VDDGLLGAMSLLSRKIMGLINSTHLIPSLAVTVFTIMFGLGLDLGLQRSLLIGLAMLFQQFSVGLSNDWLDYQRDLSSKRSEKPAVSGIVKPTELRNWSLGSAMLALVVSFLFGVTSFLLMILMLAVGWAYNLGMKSNWSSFLPYAFGFGLLPVFVGISAMDPDLPPVWVITVAALFGVSAHFANVLPDTAQDKANGVNALPHLLGQKLSAAIICLTALTGTWVVMTQSNSLPDLLAVIGVTLTVIFVGLASLLSLRKIPPRIVFQLLLLASLVNVVLLMFGISD
jgi:4-hydroxybenzoate polyprenyltransferase